MHDWKKLRQTSQRIGYRTVTTKVFKMPDGAEDEYVTYGKHGGQGGAAVIALTSDHHVVIARQFRAGPEKVFDELPGGVVEENEKPIDAARRELREETGYEPGRIESLGIVCRDAYTNDLSHYFIAYDCVKTAEQNLDAREFAEAALITIDELFNNARTTRMSDVPAVLLAYDQLQALR